MGEPHASLIALTVNGRKLHTDQPPALALVHFLREQLGLTGTKNGCDSGHCGTCMVLVNGKPTRACLVRLGQLAGASVETVEGLAGTQPAARHLHPLQRAFIEHGAVQCGFCTPGMLMVARGLLAANPAPTVGDMRAWLAQHHSLCRCTGYAAIFSAIAAAAAALRGEAGEAVPADLPPDLVEAVTGARRYAGDFTLDGMLHGAMVWSDRPHARITSLKTDGAAAMPGVTAVITARDLAGEGDEHHRPALARERVRYSGDALAAVFAATPDDAAAAAAQVQARYRALRGAFSVEEAVLPRAPRVHADGNLAGEARLARGDVDAALAQCAVVEEAAYSTSFVEHALLEPEAGVAYPNADGSVTVVTGACLTPWQRAEVAELAGLQPDQLRVVRAAVAGVFGGRDAPLLEPCLALGARRTGRPVRIALTREESLRARAKMHPATLQVRAGADRAGRLRALEVDVTLEAGAYGAPGVLEAALAAASGAYAVRNLRVAARALYTNNVPAGLVRGSGAAQVVLAVEQQVDAIACALGMDPFEFRLLNARAAGKAGSPTAAVLEAARAALHERGMPAPTAGRLIGCGVAAAGADAHVAVVEVDPTSGEARLRLVVAATGVDANADRKLAVSRIHGSVLLGLGYALSERYTLRDGVALTASLHQLRLPSAADMPDVIPVLVPLPAWHRHTEGDAVPSLATAPAILNAIFAATGLRFADLPADRHRLRSALAHRRG